MNRPTDDMDDWMRELAVCGKYLAAGFLVLLFCAFAAGAWIALVPTL